MGGVNERQGYLLDHLVPSPDILQYSAYEINQLLVGKALNNGNTHDFQQCSKVYKKGKPLDRFA